MVENKTILVTGASSGIGLSIVKLLAASGAKMILTARDELRLQNITRDLDGHGHQYVVADLEDNNQLDKLIEKFPKLDGIVFCAGYNEFIPVKFIKKEKVDKLFNINYFSSLYLIQKLLKRKLLNK